MSHFNWHNIGNLKAISLLEKDILENNLHHAYLILGENKIGKFRIAKQFAKIIQCQNNSCDDCTVCRQMDNQTHQDTMFLIDLNEKIKINDIRKIIENINLTPMGNKKIILIENLQRITIPASNALLKTLEEPPSNVIFVLTLNNIGNIPETIVSRTRVIKTNPQSKTELENFIQSNFQNIGLEKMRNIINLSGNKVGICLNLIEDPDLYEETLNLYQKVWSIIERKDILAWFNLINEETIDKEKLKNFRAVLLQVLLGVLKDPKDQIDSKYVISLIDKVFEIIKLGEQNNINSKLMFENMFLQNS